MGYLTRVKTSTGNIVKFFRRNKRARKILLLGIALLLAFPATWILQYFVSLQIETPKIIITYTVSNETTTAAPIDIVTSGPSYFESVGRIYVYHTSPYASAFVTYHLWLSLDNSSWTETPLLSSQTNNRSQMADLGLVQLDNPKITLYMKYYIPPQTLAYAVNATKEQLENSFKGYVQIMKEATSRDTTNSILVFFGFFTLILQVSDFLLLKEDSKPKKGAPSRMRAKTL